MSPLSIMKFHPKPIIYGLGILLLQHAVCAISPSQAPTMTTIQKMIRGCDGAQFDVFGNDLAVKGDWAAIGAYGVSSYSGAVYLYKHDGSHWVFMQSLTASDGAANDFFGRAVAMSGTGHLVVGALSDDFMGAVYFFTLSSTTNTWGDEQKIVASDGAADNWFGVAVAMSGTGHLVVGAYGDDDKGSDSGAIYLYTLNGTANTWGDEQKIVASDGADLHLFGTAVAMSETDHLLVGAFGDDDKAPGSGAVYAIGEGIPFNAEGGDTSESETYCTTTTNTTTTTVREVDCFKIVSSALPLLNEQHSILTTTFHFLLSIVSLGHHNIDDNHHVDDNHS